MTVPDRLLEEIAALGVHWHGAGTVSDSVLQGIPRLVRGPVRNSVETGTGRSTLLLSHLSEHHLVFTRDDAGDGDSLERVRTSPLLQAPAVEFILGPTQLTIPRKQFEGSLDLVLIDGPHAFPFPDLEYYYLYPHIRPGGLLIVDDIQIPSIRFMYRFLAKDDMWDLAAVIGTTAFFRRTEAPPFDPLGDGWWLQGYNKAVFRKGHLMWLPTAIRTPLRNVWRAFRPERF